MENQEIEIKTTRNALKWLWARRKKMGKKLYAMSNEERRAYFAKAPRIHPDVKIIRIEDLNLPQK